MTAGLISILVFGGPLLGDPDTTVSLAPPGTRALVAVSRSRAFDRGICALRL